MYPTWKITADRVKGDAEPVTIAGDFGKNVANATKIAFQQKITRHHIINIQTLQDFWNTAVERQDEDVFKALKTWAAFPESLFLAAMMSPVAPEAFQRAVCWNPFNIVLGPSTERRVGDPGEDFDDIRYTSFGDADARVARMEFNQHVERLTRINQLIGFYIAGGEAPQLRTSLISLLNDDRPSVYAKLFAVLRSKVNTKSPPYNEALDRQLSEKHTARAQEYSPDKLPGCLMDPSLWRDVTIVPPGTFQTEAHAGVHQGRLDQAVVPWVSESYLPHQAIAPVSQFGDVLLAPASHTLSGAPFATLDLSGVGRGLLERTECQRLVEKEVRKTGPFAKNNGLVLYVVGPVQQGPWRDVVNNVAGAAKSLVQQGFKLKVQPLTHSSFSKVELRIISKF